jgi:hypothetical protein
MKIGVKDATFLLVKDRAPNWVRQSIIVVRLKKYKAEDVRRALKELEDERRIDSLDITGLEEGKPSVAYRLASGESVQIRQTIKVGDIDVPRILRTDVVPISLEDMNEQVERLAEYAASLEDRFSDIVKDERKKHWGNVITLFGLFVAIFSFILVSLPRIAVQPSHGFWQIVSINAAQILPLAIVLFLFVMALKLMFR